MAETRRRVQPSRSLLVESPNLLPETNSRKWLTKVSRGQIFCRKARRQEVGPAVLLVRSQVLGVRSQGLRRSRFSWNLAPVTCFLLLQRENVVLSATRLCHPLSFK